MSIVRFFRPGARAKLLAGQRVPWIHNNGRAHYIAAVCLSAPDWADRVDLELLRAWAKAMTIFTGERHVLDHIVPVNHPRVCGLTVPWNIQVIHWRANGSKGNTWCPEQLELFPMKTILHGPVTAQDIEDADMLAGITPTSFLTTEDNQAPPAELGLSCEVIVRSTMMDYETAQRQQSMRLVTYGDALIMRGDDPEMLARAERMGLVIYQA